MSYVPSQEFGLQSNSFAPYKTITFPITFDVPGRLDIAFYGLTPVESIGVSVIVGLLPIEMNLSSLIGPAFYRYKKPIVSRKWVLTIQGIGQYADIIIPMSKYTETQMVGSQTTYTLTVPDGARYLTDIISRRDSTFTITSIEHLNDGTVNEVVSGLITILDVRSDQGSHNFSVTLSGEAAGVPSDPKKLDISNVSYVLTPANGGKTLRCSIDGDFMAGDIALFKGAQLKIQRVIKMVSVKSTIMQLSEV